MTGAAPTLAAELGGDASGALDPTPAPDLSRGS